MQWVRVRVRDRVRVKVTVRFRVSVSCAFSEPFVGIGRVGIGTCTLSAYGPLINRTTKARECPYVILLPFRL